MTVGPAASRIGSGVVLDIEGTTTPVSFVYDVLFPYARDRLRDWVREHARDDGSSETLRLLRAEWEEDVARGEHVPAWPTTGGPARDTAILEYLTWLMDRDRKSRSLKLVQGEIWEGGYRDGTLCGEVFDDVPAALERWHRAGYTVAIYSSGSVLGQRLLFANSTAGDLTQYIDYYFDTSVGPKRSSESYARIVSSVGVTAAELLFISDVAAELEAARAVGFRTLLCVRDPSTRPPSTDSPVVRDFNGIE